MARRIAKPMLSAPPKRAPSLLAPVKAAPAAKKSPPKAAVVIAVGKPPKGMPGPPMPPIKPPKPKGGGMVPTPTRGRKSAGNSDSDYDH